MDPDHYLLIAVIPYKFKKNVRTMIKKCPYKSHRFEVEQKISHQIEADLEVNELWTLDTKIRHERDNTTRNNQLASQKTTLGIGNTVTCGRKR